MNKFYLNLGSNESSERTRIQTLLKSKPNKFLINIKLHFERLNNQERRVDALALRAEERRDKLRKALGSCK